MRELSHGLLLTAVAALTMTSGCSQQPEGPDAMRKIVSAVLDTDPTAMLGAEAGDFADGTIGFGRGFIDDEDISKNWTTESVKERAAKAVAPYADKVGEVVYTELAGKYSEEELSALYSDTQDPARLKAIKCAVDERAEKQISLAWDKCDVSAFGEEDYTARWYGFPDMVKMTVKRSPAAMGAYGSIGCDLLDEFNADVSKVRDDFSLSGISISFDGGKKYGCEEFRELAKTELEAAE